MKNEAQISIINKSLQHERDKMLIELSKINTHLVKKIEMVKKILSYRNEYADTNNLKMSRTIPSLWSNLDTFTKKIQKILIVEEDEINKMKASQRTMMEKIEKLDHKIKLMNDFHKKIKFEERMKREKADQLIIDDLSSLNKIRNDYE